MLSGNSPPSSGESAIRGQSVIGRVGRGLDSGSIESVEARCDGVRFDWVELIEVEEDLGEYRFVAFLGNQFDRPVLQVNECKLGSRVR